MKEERYKIVEGSVSQHCCFKCTIIDTTKTDDDNAEVCECFELDDAEKIMKALNNLEGL